MKFIDSWKHRKYSYIHFLSISLFFLFLFVFYFNSILFSEFFIANDGSIPADFPITRWSQSIFSGYPLLNDPTFNAFYPIKFIIYKVLRLDFNFFIISGYFLMAFFTYCYVHYLTRFKISALLSSIIYSFSGYAIYEIGHATQFIHTICWMPLILLSFEKLKKQFSLFWVLVSLFAIPTSISAGFPQLSLAIFSVFLGYALLLSFQNNKKLKHFCFYLSLLMGGYLIAAPVIIPCFLLSLFSDRAHLPWEFFCSYYVELKQLLLFFFPYLMGGYFGSFNTPVFGSWEIVGNHGFVGFLSVILAVIGLWKTSPRLKATAYFWTIFVLLSLITALGPEVTFFYKILYHIPVVNNFRAPERYLFIFAFGVSILAGFGIQSIHNGLINTSSQKYTILILSILFSCLLLGCVILIYPSLSEHALGKNVHLVQWYKNPSVIIPCLWMLASLIILWLTLKFPAKLFFSLLLLLITCAELLYNAYFSYWHPANASGYKKPFFNPPEYLSFLRENLNATHQRFLKMQLERDTIGSYLWGNNPIYYNLPSAGGYTPLALKNYTEFLGITMAGNYLLPDLHSNQAINIAGIKYLFTVADFSGNTVWFADENQFKLRNIIGNTLVYENLHVLPRVWFIEKLVTLPEGEMLQVIHRGKFADESVFDPAHTALTKNSLGLEIAEDKTATATIEKIDNTTIIIKTQTQKEQFLVLSDIYYPGWKLYIDDKKSVYYLTNYVYRGLVVPAGTHRIEFRYRPLYLYFSYMISIIVLLLFPGLILYRYKSKSHF